MSLSLRALLPAVGLVCSLLPAAAAAAALTPAEGDHLEAIQHGQRDRVLPLLASERQVALLQRELAMAVQRRQPGNLDAARRDTAQQLISRPFAADLRIIFAVDGGDPAPLVSQAQLDDWGIDAATLERHARANLRRRFGGIPHKTVAKLPWLQVIDSHDGYAASRLLLDEPWDALAKRLGGRLVAGVPTRDIVVFTATADRDKLDQLQTTVDTVASNESRAITPRLFEWRNGAWHHFHVPAAGQSFPGTQQ